MVLCEIAGTVHILNDMLYVILIVLLLNQCHKSGNAMGIVMVNQCKGFSVQILFGNSWMPRLSLEVVDRGLIMRNPYIRLQNLIIIELSY